MAKTQDVINAGIWKGSANAILGISATSGIVAHAGGTQAAAITDSASWLTGVINLIATCATVADSALLPKGEVGDEIWVRNNGAASCTVYPQSGGAINGSSANAGFAVTNGKTAHFKNIGTTNGSGTGGLDWIAILSA